MKAAQELFHQGEYKRSMQRYKQLAQLYEKNGAYEDYYQANFAMVELLTHQSKFTDSEALLLRINKKLEGNVNNPIWLSRSILAEGERKIFENKIRGLEGFFKVGLHTLLEQGKEQSMEHARFLEGIGKVKIKMNQRDSAIFYLQKAEKVLRTHLPESDYRLAQCLLFLGISANGNYQFEIAKDYLNGSLQIWEAHPTWITIDYCRLLNWFGFVLRTEENFNEAIPYFEKAIALGEEKFGPNNGVMRNSYLGLAYVLNVKGSYLEALPYALRGWKVSRDIYGPESSKTIQAKANIGQIHFQLNNLDEAEACFLEIIENLDSEDDNNMNYLSFACSWLAEISLKKNDLTAATNWSKKGLQILQKQGDRAPKMVLIQALLNLAIKYERLDLQDSALYFTSIAKEHIDQLSVMSDVPKGILIDYHHIVGVAHDYTAQSDSSRFMTEMKLAMEFYQHAIALLDSSRVEQWNVESTPYRFDQRFFIFEQYIYSAYQIFNRTGLVQYIDSALQMAEHSSTFQLRKSLGGTPISGFDGVSDSLLHLEQELKSRLLSTRYGDQKTELLDSLIEQQQQLDDLEAYFKQHHPNYHQLSYFAPRPDIKEVQAQLQQDEALLQYFVGDSNSFLFAFTKEKVHWFHLDDPRSLKPLVLEYLEVVSDPSSVTTNPKQALESFCQRSSNLSQKLLPASLLEQLPKGTQITIVPSNFLTQLPFESLLIHPLEPGLTGFSKLPYFIYDYAINYRQTSVSPKKKQTSIPATHSYVGFAPSYLAEGASTNVVTRRDQELASLHFNDAEIKAVEAQFNGLTFIGPTATESNFLKHAHGADILHLAMHARVNNAKPLESQLFFSLEADSANDGQLNIYELFGFSLQANLVVLSACSTGIGTNLTGEGWLSLANAFQMSGAKSLMMSLWSVDDRSTSGIVSSVFDHLKAGNGKAKALRQAKLEYLESASEIEAHPYYWSSLVMMGDDSPLPVEVRKRSYWWFCLLLLPIAGGYWYWRKQGLKAA